MNLMLIDNLKKIKLPRYILSCFHGNQTRFLFLITDIYLTKCNIYLLFYYQTSVELKKNVSDSVIKHLIVSTGFFSMQTSYRLGYTAPNSISYYHKVLIKTMPDIFYNLQNKIFQGNIHGQPRTHNKERRE